MRGDRLLAIGLVQTCTGIDPAANAATLVAAIDRLADQGAAIIFTPEMSGCLDRQGERMAAHVGPEADDRVVRAVADAAGRRGVFVALGSVAVRGEAEGDPRWRNRSLLLGPDGTVCARYDKVHLFDVDLPTGESWRESTRYAPGARAVVADGPGLRLGLTVCYDVRFAELYLALAQAGADLIAVPAAFTVPTGEAHWHVLLRARAIETGAFVVAAAQSGLHADGRRTFGHSLVVSPWGEVLADLGEGEGEAVLTLDLGAVAEARARIPALSHRRAFALPATSVEARP